MPHLPFLMMGCPTVARSAHFTTHIQRPETHIRQLDYAIFVYQALCQYHVRLLDLSALRSWDGPFNIQALRDMQ